MVPCFKTSINMSIGITIAANQFRASTFKPKANSVTSEYILKNKTSVSLKIAIYLLVLYCLIFSTVSSSSSILLPALGFSHKV